MKHLKRLRAKLAQEAAGLEEEAAGLDRLSEVGKVPLPDRSVMTTPEEPAALTVSRLLGGSNIPTPSQESMVNIEQLLSGGNVPTPPMEELPQTPPRGATPSGSVDVVSPEPPERPESGPPPIMEGQV